LLLSPKAVTGFIISLTHKRLSYLQTTMAHDSSPPSSDGFSAEEAPTVNHRLAADAIAHLYEIQQEVEKIIQHVEALQSDSHLRLDVLNSLSRIKKKILQFESYLGIY